jgi:hypothetical protein
VLIDSTGIKVEGEWNARKHGGANRRVWRKIHLGIDEQTLQVRAIEVAISDAPMSPELLGQIAPRHEVASVSTDRAATRANAMTPSPPSPRSSRPVATPSAGRRPPRARRRAMKRRALHAASAARCGHDGADTIAEAAPRRRCVA